MANGEYDVSYRLCHSVLDEMGIDPLRDKSWEAITNVKSYREHLVTQDQERNAPLISYINYSSIKYWWIIQVYNGIPDMFSIKAGDVLKIPDLSLITSALVAVTAQTSSTPPTATI